MTDNGGEFKKWEEAILLLITALMAHYAPANMYHDRKTYTQTHAHSQTHTMIGAKPALVFTKCGRRLCKELDSEIGG